MNIVVLAAAERGVRCLERVAESLKDGDYLTVFTFPEMPWEPKFVKDVTSIPTIFALYSARKYFEQNKVSGVSLCITGGFRISPDFAKALALGADAVAIGTSAMIACGCQQYRICDSGNCPKGIATQDPELRKRLQVDDAAKGWRPLKIQLTKTFTDL